MPAPRILHPRAGHSEKVTSLTGDEYRAWTQYMQSADDFGVMRQSAATLRADNDCLDGIPEKVVERLLQRLLDVGLIRSFEHQGKRYVYQHDWQDWQKVGWPKTTILPPPSPDALRGCSELTRHLFGFHPGGVKVPKFSRSTTGSDGSDPPENFGSSSGEIPSPRAGARPSTLTSNAKREEDARGPGDFAMDAAARDLVNRYPATGRCGWNLIERPLFAVLTADAGVQPAAAWEALTARLEQQKRSEQWAVKKMVPRLDRWLRDGLHLQVLEPAETQSASDTGSDLAKERYGAMRFGK
jgi:hypothetical protein